MIPEAYYKDIFSIDYKNLKKVGIKNIFFDVDNTIVPYDENIIDSKTKKLFETLKKDFNIMLMSNSRSKRVLSFADDLNIDGYYSSMKPLKKNYKKILKKYKSNECIFIGDQFMTDVKGAKRMNLRIILVDRINDKEPIYTRFWRFFERRLLKKIKNKFEIGKYYDNVK